MLVAGPVGAVVRLVDVYGVDGLSTGFTPEGAALSFPVSVAESATDGFYEVEVVLDTPGEYFADFSVNGVVSAKIVKVGVGRPLVGTAVVFMAAHASDAATAVVTITDRSGASVGADDIGEDFTYPLAMHKVRPGRWYSDPVFFSEAALLRVAVAIGGMPVHRTSMTIGDRATPLSGQLDGLRATSVVSVDDWATLRELSNWTGWQVASQATMMRQLRQAAINSFIEYTGIQAPRVDGVWSGIVPQSGRLTLPMPMILPSDGGAEIVIDQVDYTGQVNRVTQAFIVNTYGEYSRLPHVHFGERYRISEYSAGLNEQTFTVTGTWGYLNRAMINQAIIGLAKWHSLAYGSGPDASRDRNTLNRTLSVASRDRREDYDARVVGRGLTGDLELDRILEKLKMASPAAVFRRQWCAPLS